MHQIKGFYTVDSLTNNNQNTTAMFGELSAKSRTYALDIKEFTNVINPTTKFTLFYSKSGATDKVIETVVRDAILSVGQWIFSLGDSITANTTTAGLATLILNNFNSLISEVSVGPITSDSIRFLPAWVKYKIRNLPDVTEVKSWLNDAAFQTEYDSYTIKIIPPFENIDQFFMPITDLRELVDKINPVDLTDRINEVKGDYPNTLLRAETTTYINPGNPNETFKVYWHAVIYGAAGDDSSIIRQAIIEYIEDNSNTAQTEWKNILPDLFNTTAFYILPRWDKYAIPTRRTIPGIYSPISNHKEAITFVKAKLTGLLATAHIENNLEITTHRFKSLSLAMIGGTENRGSLFKISDYFADYIGEESTNEDFNRQKEITKQWTNMMSELLIKAENYEANPTLPSHTRMVSRNNMNFLVRKLDSVEYYVALKSNYGV